VVTECSGSPKTDLDFSLVIINNSIFSEYFSDTHRLLRSINCSLGFFPEKPFIMGDDGLRELRYADTGGNTYC